MPEIYHDQPPEIKSNLEEGLSPDMSREKEGLRKVFFLPGATPGFRSKFFQGYEKMFPGVLCVEMEGSETYSDIIIGEMGPKANNKEQVGAATALVSKSGMESVSPILTVGGADLKLGQGVLVFLARNGIRHLENPSIEQLAWTADSLMRYGKHLEELSVRYLVTRVGSDGNGKNTFFVPRLEAGIETGVFEISREQGGYGIVTGGLFTRPLLIDKKLSICLSSQAGCNLSAEGQACRHCETGKTHFFGDLNAQEICDQFFLTVTDSPKSRDVGSNGSKTIFHASFMGEGEPLNNLDAVLEAIYNINDTRGFFGRIAFSFSTAGIKNGVERLLEEKDLNEVSLQPQLSLHFADERREEFLPITRGDNRLKIILPLMLRLAEKLQHRLTLNVNLFGEGSGKWQNNRPQDAERLADLCKEYGEDNIRLKLSHYNGRQRDLVAAENFHEFKAWLENDKITAQIAPNLGVLRHAGCGSLVSIKLQGKDRL